MATAQRKPTKGEWGSFQELSKEARYRLILRSYGPEKVGKNHFGFTAPGPIAVQSFDIGLEGTVEKFLREGKVIVASAYEFDRSNLESIDQDEAIVLRERFMRDYKFALTRARTVIWDTETEVWELFRYAEFGKASDAPKDYVTLNARYRDLIQLAYDSGCSLQLIQKVKEKWGSYEATDQNGRKKLKPIALGVMEPTGFKEAGYIVQTNLEHTWSKAEGFGVHVVNCRQNMALAGEHYTGRSCPTFVDLAMMVFPDSTDADWEDS